jgi:Caspase domain
MGTVLRIVWTFVLLLNLGSNVIAAGIDETYIRSGNGWGVDFFQKVFNRTGFGKSYAVVIGIGNYTNYQPLDAPAHDAIKFRDFLKYDAGFDYIVTLTDDKASKARIEALMEETIPSLIKPGDRVLFYFSGHGATRKLSIGNKRGYLILSDSGTNAWDTMIDMPRLMEWAQNVDSAQHVLFVIDACFSGLAAYQVKTGDITANTIGRLSQRAHHIVTAGIEDEESYSFNGESIFTSELLAAARGRLANEPDGIISLSEIMFNVGRAIDRRRAELREKIKMSPHMYQTRLEEGDGGESFFLAKPSATATPIMSPAISSPRAPEIESKRGDAVSSPDMDKPIVAPVALPQSNSASDEIAWNSVSSSRDPKEIEGFIVTFPTSPFRSKAEALLRELRLANLPPAAEPTPPATLPPATSPGAAAPVEEPINPSDKIAPATRRPKSGSPAAAPRKDPSKSVNASGGDGSPKSRGANRPIFTLRNDLL